MGDKIYGNFFFSLVQKLGLFIGIKFVFSIISGSGADAINISGLLV